MRTMRRIMKGMALAAVCVLALSGCVREVMDEEAGVVKIAFSASPTATRTEFENPVSPSGITKEHVYWRNGDAVAVCSDLAANQAGTSHSAVYTVSASSENLTEVPATSADGLRWADKTSVHKFFAVYGSGATVNMTKMVGTMPAAQTLTWNEAKTVGKAPMAYAFMVSTKESVKVDALEMKFNQMYTAFQFTVSSGDNEAVSLTSFTLSSTSAALAGGFEVDYNATTPTAISRATDAEPTKSITVTFPKTGDADFQVVKNAPVTFTVLALAQPLETMTNLSIEFTGPEIGTRKLALKANGGDGEFIQFAPGTKHIINGLSFPNLLKATGEDIIWEQTAIGEDIAWLDDSYVLNRVNPTGLTYMGGESKNGAVISYKLENGGATKTPVEWTVLGYYPTVADAQAGTNPYSSLVASEWMTRYTTTAYPEDDGKGVGSVTGETVRIVYNESAVETQTEYIQPATINAEIASNPFGLGSSPDCYFNLANPADMRSDYIVESANSYIINGPGYYRIPLVMGNGVKANALNTKATTYTGFSVSGKSAKKFRDYKDQNIVSPLLHKSSGSAGTPLSAFLVWEDAPALSAQGLIAVGSNNVIKAEPGHSVITSTKSLNITEGDSEDNRVYWLNFQVAEGTQGNAVIAITDGEDGTGTVMWSYHIWVTNYVSRYGAKSQDLSMELNVNRAAFNGQATTTYKMMTLNLGWIYGGTNLTATKYKSDKLYARIQQAESGKITIMEILRPGHHVVTKYDTGNSPYYQWGRKDPFIPIDAIDDTHPADAFHTETGKVIGGRYNSFTKQSEPSGNNKQPSFGYAIQHPELFICSPQTTAWFYFSDVSGTDVYTCANAWSADIDLTVAAMTNSNTPTGTDSKLREYKRNSKVYKTIYDPCPAGYSVPSYGASSFRTDDNTTPGVATYNGSTWTPPTSVQYNSNYNYGTAAGSYYTSSTRTMDAYMRILGIKDGYAPDSFSGFNFYSNSEVEYFKPESYSFEVPKTITLREPAIYYPTVGFRAYSAGNIRAHDVSLPQGYGLGKRGYFWSAMEQSYSQGCGFDFEHYWKSNGNDHYFNVKNWSYFPMADGCSIRPMQNDN